VFKGNETSKRKHCKSNHRVTLSVIGRKKNRSFVNTKVASMFRESFIKIVEYFHSNSGERLCRHAQIEILHIGNSPVTWTVWTFLELHVDSPFRRYLNFCLKGNLCHGDNRRAGWKMDSANSVRHVFWVGRFWLSFLRKGFEKTGHGRVSLPIV
jgi:hypothetical protein